VDTKRCRICGEFLPVTQFYKCRANKDGLQSKCKVCSATQKGSRYTGRVQKNYQTPDGFRLCRVCDEVKPLTEFHRSPNFKDGYRTTCRQCRAVAEGRIFRPAEPDGFKRCRKCGELKPATTEYFSTHIQCKGGLNSSCRDCVSKRAKTYRDENREKILADKKIYRETYPDRVRQQFLAWLEKNRERVKIVSRTYYLENREQIREKGREHYLAHQFIYVMRSREWRKNNPQKFSEQTREWRKKKPERVKATLTRYRARKRNLPDHFTGNDWEQCLKYWDYSCAVCARMSDDKYLLGADHWIPISDDREDNPGTVTGNIIPLCCCGVNNCNSSKSNKNARDWLIQKLGEQAAMQKLAEIEAYFEFVKNRNSEE
jgi:hypothetical protein